MPTPAKILVIGAGAIGTAMAAVFSAGGDEVTLLDPDAGQRSRAASNVDRHLNAIRRSGGTTDALVPNSLSTIATLDEISDADLVIEAGPENVDVKAALFKEMLEKFADGTVLATTSSAIPVSAILPNPADQRQCLVAHPGNPPSLIRVLELVPAPGTSGETKERAAALFTNVGFDAVQIRKEVPGFVFNRLQSALLREAYRLVDEDVIGVDDLDRLVRDGLGPRWALSGPFETADLNTAGGVRGHAERMGPAYAKIGEARGETNPSWSPELVDQVEQERRAVLPEDQLNNRRAWRETALADLMAARRTLMSDAS